MYFDPLALEVTFQNPPKHPSQDCASTARPKSINQKETSLQGEKIMPCYTMTETSGYLSNFLKGIPTHPQLLFQILIIFGTCVSQMYFLTYQKIASVVAETIASVKKQLHDKEIDLQPLNFIQPMDLREVFCKPSHQANPFNQTNQGNVPKITAASVPVIISTTNLILQAQAHDWKSPDMFDGATPNSVSMQNFKMRYKKN